MQGTERLCAITFVAPMRCWRPNMVKYVAFQIFLLRSNPVISFHTKFVVAESIILQDAEGDPADNCGCIDFSGLHSIFCSGSNPTSFLGSNAALLRPHALVGGSLYLLTSPIVPASPAVGINFLPRFARYLTIFQNVHLVIRNRLAGFSSPQTVLRARELSSLPTRLQGC